MRNLSMALVAGAFALASSGASSGWAAGAECPHRRLESHDGGSSTIGTAGSAAAGGTSASTIGMGANSTGQAGTSSTVGGAGKRRDGHRQGHLQHQDPGESPDAAVPIHGEGAGWRHLEQVGEQHQGATRRRSDLAHPVDVARARLEAGNVEDSHALRRCRRSGSWKLGQ